jgi:hypothetical protein
MNRNYATQFSHVIPFENSIPYLYRYEDKKWINDFFEMGYIKLSSFKNYKNHPDNQLGDKNEGNSMNIVNGNNEKMIGTFTSVGHNEYCFCTSTILDDKLKGNFKRDSVFRIIDPLNFMLEITRSLPRVQGVLFGNCIYVNHRIISTRISKPIEIDQLKYKEDTEKISFEKMMEVAAPSITSHRFFLKHINYQEQSEYRILWSVDRVVDEGIILYCPEARKFCEEIEYIPLSSEVEP